MDNATFEEVDLDSSESSRKRSSEADHIGMGVTMRTNPLGFLADPTTPTAKAQVYASDGSSARLLEHQAPVI